MARLMVFSSSASLKVVLISHRILIVVLHNRITLDVTLTRRGLRDPVAVALHIANIPHSDIPRSFRIKPRSHCAQAEFKNSVFETVKQAR